MRDSVSMILWPCYCCYRYYDYTSASVAETKTKRLKEQKQNKNRDSSNNENDSPKTNWDFVHAICTICVHSSNKCCSFMNGQANKSIHQSMLKYRLGLGAGAPYRHRLATSVFTYLYCCYHGFTVFHISTSIRYTQWRNNQYN